MKGYAKDSLGERMKTFYEARTRSYLPRRSNAIIRIDGCHFHTFTRGFAKPFDELFIEAMQKTTKALCENIQGCKMGYVESDEISLLLTDYDTLTTDAWFDYQVQKMCSVAASMAAVYFNKYFMEGIEARLSTLKSDQPRLQTLLSAAERGAYFDARCFTLPTADEVVNYFIWRENDSIRNSISGLAQSLFSQKELNGISATDLKDKMLREKNVDWNSCSAVERQGSCVVRDDLHKWSIDTDIPLFTMDREYILKNLPKI